MTTSLSLMMDLREQDHHYPAIRMREGRVILARDQAMMSDRRRQRRGGGAFRAARVSGDFQQPLAVPVGDALARILREARVLGALRHLDPWRGVIHHDLDLLH